MFTKNLAGQSGATGGPVTFRDLLPTVEQSCDDAILGFMTTSG